jgi:hypothetical protein
MMMARLWTTNGDVNMDPRNYEHTHRDDGSLAEDFDKAAQEGAREMDKVARDAKKALKKVDDLAEEGADAIDDALDDLDD